MLEEINTFDSRQTNLMWCNGMEIKLSDGCELFVLLSSCAKEVINFISYYSYILFF